MTPGPQEAVYPTILDDQPAPHLPVYPRATVAQVYPRATVAAEKFETIVSLGMANSRLKDYFDLRALASEGKIDDGLMADAIGATLERRGTALPEALPLGLSAAFGADPSKKNQWAAFLSRNQIDGPALETVVEDVRRFFDGPMAMVRERAGRK